MEKWKNIAGYEGKYQISSLGRVKSLNYRNTRKKKIIKLKKEKNGYIRVGLHYKGKQNLKSVHRLVAEAFIPNPNNYPIINHKDENKQNNRVDNLEWCTIKYNNNYGTRIEKAKIKMKENHADYSGEKHPMYGKHHTQETKNKISKALTEIYSGGKGPRSRKVICITTGEIFDTAEKAANKAKTHESSIIKCCRGKRKSSGKLEDGTKLEWEYID